MPDFIDTYAAQRDAIWPEVEAFFNEWPPSLRQIGHDFMRRLTGGASSSDLFSDAFRAPHIARIVYLPLWCLEAYRQRGITIPDAEQVGRHLFVSALTGFCAIRIHDDLVDEDKSDVSVDELLLDNLFTLESIRRLQRLFPSDSPIWEYYTRCWRNYTDAVGYEKNRDRNGLAPVDETMYRQAGAKAELLKTYPVAVALKSGQTDDIDRIDTMMDAFNTGVQLINDLQSLQDDVENRHYTAPVSLAGLAAGNAEGTHPPVEGLYGALILKDAIPRVCERARRCCEQARTISDQLGITDLSACLDWYLKLLEQTEQNWNGQPNFLELLK